MRDDDVRSSCFASLDVLRATFGDDVPYREGLQPGFPFRGRKVPFLTPYRGIYRSAAQRGPAALSINTSFDSPYQDEETEGGFLYDYLAGEVDQPDNRALRSAHELQVPLVYFVGTRPGWYRPEYPYYVTEDRPTERRVLVSPGAMAGSLEDPEPIPLDDAIERRYAVREVLVRLHQVRFRGRVLPAYRDQCAVCRLKEVRLLDAAHIISDVQAAGVPVVSNGLSMCSIHHRAFDHNLVGISPNYTVHISPRLLEDDDGPMLDLLKTFEGESIQVPVRKTAKPDRDLLAMRFSQFKTAA